MAHLFFLFYSLITKKLMLQNETCLAKCKCLCQFFSTKHYILLPGAKVVISTETRTVQKVIASAEKQFTA